VGTNVAVAPAVEPRAGWAQLVDLRADALHFAGWLGIPASSREDVVHTALVRVYPHVSALDKPSSLKAYLFATVRNLWRNECRRSGSRAPTSLDEVDVTEPSLSPDERLLQQSDCDTARIAFECLRSPEREVIHLRYVDALGYDDLANRLGVTQVAARQRLHRARRALGAAYKRIEAGEPSYSPRA
jgi:RNA polymerase sigma-70 factor (ECF subfamily)